MPLGIYHNPGIWFGEREGLFEASNPDFMPDEIIAKREFPPSIITVSRDGLFVFDFSKWIESRDDLIKRRMKQIEVMNAYLLCFYCAVATRGLWVQDFRRSMPMMRADHNNVLGIANDLRSGMVSAGLSDDMLRLTTRREYLKAPGVLFTAQSLPEQVLSIAFDLFDVLCKADDTVFTFADLMLGAHVAHFNLRFPEALGLGWLTIETFLDMLWNDYVNCNRRRNGKTFINKDRKEKLETGREYTASVRIEILSLLDKVSYELYLRLNTARQARNHWIHELLPPTIEESAETIRLAERLFRDSFNFETTLPPYAGSTFVGGGEYLDRAALSVNLLMREFTFDKSPIHHSGLDKELREALGEHTVGISSDGRTVRVHLKEDAPPDDDQIAQQIIEAHDPAFLSIDNAHSSLPGEFKFDGKRLQPYVIGNGLDAASVRVSLPHTAKSQVVLLIDNQKHTLDVQNGIGVIAIKSNDAPGTRVKVSVQDHPCDPLEIEIIAAK